MEIRQETIYKCEHCGKMMFRKGSMSLHERMCNKNPNNRHKCFQYCKYLYGERTDGKYYFTCKKEECGMFGQDMHSYKLERNYIGKERIEDEKLRRMPLECEYYEIEEGHETYI